MLPPFVRRNQNKPWWTRSHPRKFSPLHPSVFRSPPLLRKGREGRRFFFSLLSLVRLFVRLFVCLFSARVRTRGKVLQVPANEDIASVFLGVLAEK